MNLKGSIYKVFEKVRIKNEFDKLSFVLSVEDRYKTDLILFEVYRDKCEIFQELQIGDKVQVDFEIRGRKGMNADRKKQYFNSLRAWKIEKLVEIE
jgi:hypothetical protein